MKIIDKPNLNEFQANESLLANLIPGDGLLLKYLNTNIETTTAFISSLPQDRLKHRYAQGKWTIKEILMHLIEMERVYTYRILRFARNDQTVLPGFDADQYILNSKANDREIETLLEELNSVRKATICLLNGLPEESFLRSGSVNGNLVSVRALAYHIAGHELHHVNIIKERYL